ncbi:Interleukin-1 receptor-associated kinase 4 like protein [Argiope bruennichi]|uniref:non-specific serine/threonine protein kinase n=1 Tax=Argiope bruennichi TaxID=94029 RepID=A0A8T0EQK2_ARGBR|nr:Interleukin-1 receptor-associated kinase 4 like protein [Argiope bruennichi]
MTGNTRVAPAMLVNTGPPPTMPVITGPPPVMPVINAPPPVMPVINAPPPVMPVINAPPPVMPVINAPPPVMPVITAPPPVMPVITAPPPVMPVNTGSIPFWSSNIVHPSSMPVNPGFTPASTMYTSPVPFSTVNTGPHPNMTVNTQLAPSSTMYTSPVPFSTVNTGPHPNMTINTQLAPSSTMYTEHLTAVPADTIPTIASTINTRPDPFSIANTGFAFDSSLTTTVKCKHENLLRLLGFSDDGSNCCLVYEYMPNGSLEDRLACSGGSLPLPSLTRLHIAYFSAVGLNYLHNFSKPPLVHRDVKSANILLDENFIPKIGDFGLVRIGGNSSASTMAITKHCCGTEVYMAREARYGDVSVKLDTFSFGVVLLEILTGLPPYDIRREDRDLVTHMEDCEDILTMLDQKVLWNEGQAIDMYKIANQCLIYKKKQRPTIGEILPDLESLLNEFDF